MKSIAKTGTAFLLLAVILLTGCQKVLDFIPESATSKKTITKIVRNSPEFSLLETALLQTGLDEALEGSGPFTVFAPTDDAFHAAGFNSADDIKSVPVATLKTILLYHVLGSKVLSSAIPAAANTEVATLNSGVPVFVTKMNNKVCVNGAEVVIKDIIAKNGVIHAVNKVLFPPTGTIVDAVAGNPDFSLLLQAVIRAGSSGTDIAAVLSSAGPFTVFAPTNSAFQDLLTALGAASLNDIPATTLRDVLLYHVISSRVFSCNLTDGLTAGTALPGTSLEFDLSAGAKVKGSGNTSASGILKTDIVTTNGVIHVIDRVLLP